VINVLACRRARVVDWICATITSVVSQREIKRQPISRERPYVQQIFRL
jgi:hypothetical protein